MRPKLTVIGWIQVQKGAGFGQHPAFKGTAVDGRNSFGCGCRGPVGVEFNASHVCTGILGKLDQRAAIANTGINGRIGCTWYQQRADVLGFLDRQRVIAQLDASRIPHRSSKTFPAMYVAVP